MVTEKSLIFENSQDGLPQSCKRTDTLCEVDKGAFHLEEDRLVPMADMFCKILSHSWSEIEMLTEVVDKENDETQQDSDKNDQDQGEKELTSIWSRRAV